MADPPSDLVPSLLTMTQRDLTEMRNGYDARFDKMDERFNQVEGHIHKPRCDIAGILAMMMGAAGIFDDWLPAIETRDGSGTATIPTVSTRLA